MKKILSLVTILSVVSIFFSSCSEEEPPVSGKEQISFSLSLPASTNDGGRATEDIPDGARVLISIANQDGPVLTNHEVKIYKLGDGFITDPLELEIGRYSVTDFMIANDDDEILYATPKRGSPLGDAVSNPLPFSFVVGKDKITTYPMEVLDARQSTPEAFGYTSFSIKVVNPLAVSVFVEKDGKLIFTEAHATLYDAETYYVLQTTDLEAKINYLNFNGERDRTYRLAVEKDGYADGEVEFVYAETDNSLTVVLVPNEVPMLTLSTLPVEDYVYFQLQVLGTGSLTVDWGDGKTETRAFNAPDRGMHASQPFFHTYSALGNYEIKVTGNVEMIFSVSNGTIPVHDIDLSDIPDLEMFRINQSILDTLDVSMYPNIHYFTLENTIVQHFDINSAKLIDVGLVEMRDTDTLNEVIGEIYDETLDKGISGEILAINMTFSGENQELVDKLVNEHDWILSIYP